MIDRLEFGYDDRVEVGTALDVMWGWLQTGRISKIEWDEVRMVINDLKPEVVFGPPFRDYIPFVQEKNSVITNVVATPTGTDCTITWTSGIPTDSTVNYGTTATYGTVANDPIKVMNHSVTLTSLTAATEYHYKVGDSAGGAESTDATFTTAVAS